MPMTVKAIMCRKGHDVITIAATATLSDAVRTLAEHRIGAVVISGPDRQVAGILSERDIVRALTRKVMTCTESETVVNLMERMTEGKFRHLPVVEHGRLRGIVSIGDVVKYRLSEMEHESRALREYILTA
jgi:CBS domain-containing protein